jgi:hypothetical protein
MTVSVSTSETDKCGVIDTLVEHQPFLCIRHPSDSEETYLPCLSDPMANSTDAAWSMGGASPAAYTWPSFMWQGGDTIPFSFQVDQPLSLSTDLSDYTYGGVNATSRDADFPELVDVSEWMRSTARSAPLKILVSTTVRFYVWNAADLSSTLRSPGGTTDGTVSQTMVAKRQLVGHLSAFPQQRVGVLLRFGGAFDEDAVELISSLFEFQIPIDSVTCGRQLLSNHERLLTGSLEGTRHNISSGSDTSTYSAPSANETTLTVRLELLPPKGELEELSATVDAITEALTPVTTALSLAAMMPSAILAMGVQNSISGISTCQGLWVPVSLEHTDITYHVADLEAMVHNKFDILSSPTGLRVNIIGDPKTGWVGPDPRASAAKAVRSEAIGLIPQLGHYMRGAVVASIALIAAFALGVFCLFVVVWRVRRAFGVDMKTAQGDQILLDSELAPVPPALPQQSSWWVSERQDLSDAAALLQLPSVSLLALAILGDGISLGGAMLITLRVSFMKDDGYAAVYRSLALQHGFIPELLFGDEYGRLEAPGMIPVVLDMMLAVSMLALMFGYTVHLFYVTYNAPLGVAVVVEGPALNAPPIPTLEEAELHGEVGNGPPPIQPAVDDEPSIHPSMCSSLPPSEAPVTLKAAGPRCSTLRRALAYLFDSSAELQPIKSQPDQPPPTLNEGGGPDGDDTEMGITNSGLTDKGDDRSSSSSGPDELYEAGERWMSKYGLYVGGTTWALYLPIDFTVAFVIGCLEGIATGSLRDCAIKAILSVLLLLAQLFVLLYKRPLSARFDQVSTVVSITFTTISGSLVVVDLLTNRSNVVVGAAAEIIMLTAAFTVSAQAIIGAINSVLHIQGVVRRILQSITRRIKLMRHGQPQEMPPMDADQFDDAFIGGYEDPNYPYNIPNDSILSAVSLELHREEDDQQNQDETIHESAIWRGFLTELEVEDELRLQQSPPNRGLWKR